MPTISSFYGILIRMYFFDAEQHHLPHIHAQYQGQQAQFAIDSGEVLAGALPRAQTRLVPGSRSTRTSWRQRGRWPSTVFAPAKSPPCSDEGARIMNPQVTRATPQADHRLLLEFDNGETRLFDLTPWLDKGVFRALRDSPEFAQARVVDGSVEWPGEIDLSYDTLYLRSVVVKQATAA
ncbi:MAG TPA: DUF4160 domain-containing protein [Burkholderiaceae bacterium]|nr:DUF4160 domain-containing protein [Burkholderiaceae bacterium]